MNQIKIMKPKYYLAKTIIGSDKDYLPLLENIVWMPKMTDPAKGNLESFLIVDEESIEMMKSTPRNADGNYYDFVLSTVVELITINQLIDRVASEELRDDAHSVYQKLRDATKVNFPQLGDFEVLPISSQADFAKALNWSHYRILSGIKKANERKFLEDLTKQNGWEVKDLQQEAGKSRISEIRENKA